jgi:hypothetical protein
VHSTIVVLVSKMQDMLWLEAKACPNVRNRITDSLVKVLMDNQGRDDEPFRASLGKSSKMNPSSQTRRYKR